MLRLPYPPTPQNAPALAETCVEAARAISGHSLDYKPESVEVVDEQIERFSEGGVSVEEIASTLFCFGCYLGEVLVRNLGGRWVEEENSPMRDLAGWPMVTLMENGSCWNPIGRVFKRFEEGSGEGLQFFYETVESHVRRRRTRADS